MPAHLLTVLSDIVLAPQAAGARAGFTGFPIPSLPATETWVSYFLVALTVLLALAYLIDRQTITECFNISFKLKERNSIFTKTTLQNPWSQVFFTLYQWGILALAAQTFLCPETVPFSLVTALRYALVFCLFFLAKFLVLRLLNYVFLPTSTNAAQWIKTYFTTIGAFCLVLLPIVVLYIYLPEKYVLVPVTLLIIAITSMVSILLVKLFQLFLRKALALFYILLYLCTLEIFPISGLIILLKASI